ncbi:MAG: radical SAM family heme chaperone HemW, partial [Deltaproteobacteria bacterium]|nr:radical SAM family heme chaperone HemW [Deltaproteobacteria bacterium]
MNKGSKHFNGNTPGLYIHVPFCLSKCPYCDFYSITSISLIPSWLEGVLKELQMYKDRFSTFDTLYMGGGTPSLLNPNQLSTLMDFLVRNFEFSPETEITIEANPDDITREKLECYRDIGINRISLGAQSFDDRVLQYLKRRHTARKTEKALEWIRAAGFNNIGIDLMYGFEGQTEAAWVGTMKHALDFRPEHLSCYQMTYSEGTPFGNKLAQGRITQMGEEEERAFFLLTSRFLEQEGYLHYEISNFARDKKHVSRHNLKYWRHVPYLGIGPGAHSFLEGRRWWNIESVSDYCRMLSNGCPPVEETETLSEEQRRLEMLYLGLRTVDGVDLGLVDKQHQSKKIIGELMESGLVKVHADRVIPTRTGFLVADSLPL